MKVKDNITGKIETVIQTTTNSYLVTQTKLTDKGINCDNWFDENTFKKRFEKIENEKG
jgi:hypothetical protein